MKKLQPLFTRKGWSILIVYILCVGLLNFVPNVESDVIMTQGRAQHQDLYQTIRDDNPDTNYPGIAVNGNETIEWRGLVYIPLITNLSNVIKVELSLRTFSVTGLGNTVSLHYITEQWDKADVTWNDRKDGEAWNTAGGKYEAEALDAQSVGANNQWYKWNITTYYLDSFIGEGMSADYYGFILIGTTVGPTWKGVAFQSVGEGLYEDYPRVIYTVENATEGRVTSITKDVWNLKGFANLTHKLGSTIYSEISDCVAISWKNGTSGWWYTYWPALGMSEDEYLEFGDGLFILADVNTTWNHT